MGDTFPYATVNKVNIGNKDLSVLKRRACCIPQRFQMNS